MQTLQLNVSPVRAAKTFEVGVSPVRKVAIKARIMMKLSVEELNQHSTLPRA